MVKGELMRMLMDFVARKRGVEGLNKVVEKANEKEILFTKESDIKPGKDYPSKFYIRILNATIDVLKDEELVRELGRHVGENAGVSFRGIAGRYPPRKSVQQMVIYSRKYLPVFHTGYRTISDGSSYWIKVSRINSRVLPMVDGFITYLFEVHGGVVDVKKDIGENYVRYVIHF